ncbi:hypothetical protein SADUNF_Sadunf16G0103600 [Salix dunnii]|uniref:Uncharacterized protein n=1 Tax=Salix dunnii TaxID=1413687 RepID=A0A835MGK5_9ROSI|nr:hypothetical protein SADUNF_Sadunf16G0103600 [Salix dunnii]
MLNPKRSVSASFFDMEVNSRPRAPFLPRSARDSFAFLKEPCSVKSGNGKGFTTDLLSAQRSRLRKLLYVEKLERNVKAEEESVYQQYQMALTTEIARLKEILGGLEREKAMKEGNYATFLENYYMDFDALKPD